MGASLRVNDFPPRKLFHKFRGKTRNEELLPLLIENLKVEILISPHFGSPP